MKRVLVLLVLIAVFGYTPVIPAHAAGNLCCPGNMSYFKDQNRCRDTGGGARTDPNPCAENEQCYGASDGGPQAGICSEQPPTKCKNGTCSGSATCINNYCVVGQDTSLTPFKICDAVGDAADKSKCTACLGNKGVWTAVGCVHFEPKNFVADFLKIAIGIAGGIALLLMVYGAFQISISAGDPKKSQEGKDIITGTIAGLLFIIFSVVLLKIIGISILQIPGLM